MKQAVKWLPEFVVTGDRTVHAILVEGELRARRVLWSISLFRLVLYAGVLLLLARQVGDAVPWWFIIFIGGTMATWIAYPLFAARTYVHGFMDARVDTVQRALMADSPEEWLEAMAVHDGVHLLGLSPKIPDSPEGLDE